MRSSRLIGVDLCGADPDSVGPEFAMETVILTGDYCLLFLKLKVETPDSIASIEFIFLHKTASYCCVC